MSSHLKMSFPRFEELPVELQEQIVSTYPESIPRVSQVSQGLYALTRRPYEREICQQPLTEKERERFMTKLFEREVVGSVYPNPKFGYTYRRSDAPNLER